MKFSFWSSSGHSWEHIVDTCRHAERAGWDGVWIPDHFMAPAAGYGDETDPEADPELRVTHEAWALLAALAVAVPRIRLGPLVCGNTYRHPAVLAKMAATVDRISGGRLVLGLGAGWQENEHHAYGIEFSTVAGRFDRLDEACRVIKALFSATRADFAGRHYRLTNAPLEPKPLQEPLPLLIGGGGERRTLRIVAEHADEWNVWATPEEFAHKYEVLERHCDAVGRDRADIATSAQALVFICADEAAADRLRHADIDRPTLIGTPTQLQDQVGAYAEAGVDELVVPDFTFNGPDETHHAIDAFISEVAGPLR